MTRQRKAGIVIIAFFLFLAVISLFATPHSPFEMDTQSQFAPPSFRHPFGTDNFGRDILSRTMVGVRYSLFFTIAAVTLSLVMGVSIGLGLAFSPPPLVMAVMRLMDAINSIPIVLLAMVLLQALRTANLASGGGSLIAAMTFVFTPTFVRIARNETTAIKQRGYIDHAKALGASDLRIMYAHILPVLAPSIMSTAIIAAANCILIESVLSYLGFGIQPPLPSLGRMMSDAQAFLFNAPWAALFPGITAALLLVGVNYLGESDGQQILRKPKAAPPALPAVAANFGDTAVHNPPLLRVDALAAGVVHGASLTINDGECVGIAGESGAGKTTLALALFGLSAAGIERVGGGVYFRGQDITALDAKERAAFLAKETGFVFQDPQSTLNPLMRVGKQVAERLLLQSAAQRDTAVLSEINSRVRAVFRDVGLPDDDAFLRRYPHELSGGQQQRVVIAIAIVHRPSLIIADEPTASLDPGIREDMAALLERLAREQSSALLLVSHDWPLLLRMCPRIYVMCRGEFVEEGAPKDILSAPQHPYTQAVVKAMPSKEKRGQDL